MGRVNAGGVSQVVRGRYGSTDNGELLIIDPATGEGTLVESTGHSFWGAGVTTVAPIVK